MNASYHRTIGMRPDDVNDQNVAVIFERLYPPLAPWPDETKFKVNDPVRIAFTRETFKKSYLVNYSNAIYRIDKIIWRHPVVYKLRSAETGEKVPGTFYSEELVKIDESIANVYRIEKVWNRRVFQGRRQLLVSWQNIHGRTWLDESQLIIK